MSDACVEFFRRLESQGHEPLLADVTGTMRFDVLYESRTEIWFISITSGDVVVRREERSADCIIRIGHELLDQIVRGEANADARWLRNEFTIQGNPTLLDYLQRIFPDPPRSHETLPAKMTKRR